MRKTKTIDLTLAEARTISRLLERLEVLECDDCPGKVHLDSCPARRAYQLGNLLTQRINNPDRRWSGYIHEFD